MHIIQWISQIESAFRHWPWWVPGVIAISIVLLPTILFSPLDAKFQRAYDGIIEFCFTGAGIGFIALYAVYGLVFFDKFLAGVAISITFILAVMFAGFAVFGSLVDLSDYFYDKRMKEYHAQQSRLMELGSRSNEEEW